MAFSPVPPAFGFAGITYTVQAVYVNMSHTTYIFALYIHIHNIYFSPLILSLSSRLYRS